MVVFRLAWSLFVITTPVLGMWLASSLASYLDGPRWVALGAGALLFPVLPLVWEMRAGRKRKKKNDARLQKGLETKAPILTFGDRLTLRTLCINLLFIIGLVGSFPTQTFPALTTRGTWFLENEEFAHVDIVRNGIYEVAECVVAPARTNRSDKEIR